MMTWEQREELRHTALPLTDDKALPDRHEVDGARVPTPICRICSKCYEHATPYRPASIAWTIIRNTLLILAVFLGAFMGTTFTYSMIVSLFPRLFD
jgi:hypothetical protein